MLSRAWFSALTPNATSTCPAAIISTARWQRPRRCYRRFDGDQVGEKQGTGDPARCRVQCHLDHGRRSNLAEICVLISAVCTSSATLHRYPGTDVGNTRTGWFRFCISLGGPGTERRCKPRREQAAMASEETGDALDDHLRSTPSVGTKMALDSGRDTDPSPTAESEDWRKSVRRGRRRTRRCLCAW
jgi:hypothetical protein